MPLIHFAGRVLPEHTPVNMPRTASIAYRGHSSGIEADFTFAIKDSRVEVECQTNTTDIPFLWVRAFELLRGMVDAMSFSKNYGLSVVIDTFAMDGNALQLRAHAPELDGLCTAFDMGTAAINGQVHPAIAHILQTRALMLALNDLTVTITTPYTIRVNCGRAVESIRNLIAPGMDRKQQWPIMRDMLNVSEAYLSLVTDESVAPRHGDLFGKLSPNEEEVRKRAWTVMDRYLHFAIRNRQKLPISEFPLL